MTVIIPMKEFEIESIEELTKQTVDSYPINSFKMKPMDDKNYTFKPGMFSSIYLHREDKLFRSYSIASSPHSDYMEFMIEMINGKFTSQLAKLNKGDHVLLTEPKGTFIYDPYDKKEITFIAAGVGIAPFFSMLRYTKFINLKRNISLFYSVKHRSDIVNFSELKSYEDIGLSLYITITRDPKYDDWNGEYGRINIDMLNKHLPDLKNRIFYICGGIKFVKDLVQTLTSNGVNDEDIKRDIWGE